MQIAIYLLLMIFLLLLNSFFVLAEFAAVKIRPTQIQALIQKGDLRGKAVHYIQTHLDEFLSVCQVGITFASIGLGFVGEPALASLIRPVVKFIGGEYASDALTHGIAISIGYILVSFLHIVIGELIPKSVAIRSTEKSVLLIAYPMIAFRYLFAVPIWFLNSTVTIFFKLIRYNVSTENSHHSEDEVRVILEQSQTRGMMSFRRLLYMENVLDMELLKIKNAMQPLRKVQYLTVGATRAETEEIIKKYRYSRYPIIAGNSENPIGFIHVKDLYLSGQGKDDKFELSPYVRPCLKVNDTEPLEQTLATMQKKGIHMALVFDKNKKWIGIATLEDVIEEVIGTIEEEYPLEQPVHLSDYLSKDKVLLDIEGDTVMAVVKNALKTISSEKLPLSQKELIIHLTEREKMGETYVGHGLAIPHARINSITKTVVIFVRLKTPIELPNKKNGELVNYLFILITPADIPRIHQTFLSHIAGIFESDFFENRLDDNISAEEIYKSICIAEETMLS